jgi:hypothetical protein
MLASVRLRSVAIYFRTPPEVPKRQVKPWSQKIEPSTWLDPPIQTYNDVGPKWEGANHNMAEVGRFFEWRRVRGRGAQVCPTVQVLCARQAVGQGLPRRSAITSGSLRRANSKTAGIGE